MHATTPGTAVCPTCGSDQALGLGSCGFAEWAESESVAELRASAGGLYRCPACFLIFRWPVPTEKQLSDAYASIPTDAWSYTEPPYWAWTLDALRSSAPNHNVLDVGCFRGDFSGTLPPEWRRYGIEPNTAAADVARTKGITVLGALASDRIEPPEDGFGAIVMFDVIEHVTDPAATVAHLSGYLADGGLIIIVTGNADHWLPRWSLPDYWYMSFPYHLCHLSRRYFSWLCARHSLRIIDWKSFSHHQYGPRHRLRQYAEGLKRIIRHAITREQPRDSPPMLFGVADHCWVVLRKGNP
jgi:SAM-dependent methyltransferase